MSDDERRADQTREERTVPVTVRLNVDGRKAIREIKRFEAVLDNVYRPLDAEDARLGD